MLIKKYRAFKRPLYIVFIDYQKTFDSLLHSSICVTLLSQEVPLDYIKVLKIIYENTTSRVKLETTVPPKQISKSVRQGDPL